MRSKGCLRGGSSRQAPREPARYISRDDGGNLTDNDLDRAAGKFDVLVGILQEKYGYTREQAADEVNKRVTDFEANLKADPAVKP